MQGYLDAYICDSHHILIKIHILLQRWHNWSFLAKVIDESKVKAYLID